jgi:hypothetical protein
MTTIVPIFKGVVVNNNLIIENQENYKNWLYQLNDKCVEVLVREPKKIRSPQANRYYFGVVLKLISKETGETVEDLHNHFSFKWLGTTGKSGKLVSRKSTALLTKQEFSDYLNKIIQWGEEFLNITFPEPENVDLDFVVW